MILYIADADNDSRTAGSSRGKALKKYLNNIYSINYISLSGESHSNEKKDTIKIYFKINKYLKFFFKGINKSFRTIDRSMISVSFFRNLNRIIFDKNKKYEVIYCSYKPAAAPWLGIAAKILKRGPLIIEYRDLMSAFADRDKSSLLRITLSKLDCLIEKTMLRFVDKVVVVSPTQQKEFFRMFGISADVVLNGIDGEILQQPTKLITKRSPKEINIGYAGSLSDRRNLRCLAAIKGEFTLHLMSNECPSKYGLPEGVKCVEHGYVDREQMQSILSKCDFFLLLEGKGQSSMGNIPSKVFEYMRYGKPILFYGNKEADICKILDGVGLLIDIGESGKLIYIASEMDRVNGDVLEEKLKEYKREYQLEKIGTLIDELKIHTQKNIRN